MTITWTISLWILTKFQIKFSVWLLNDRLELYVKDKRQKIGKLYRKIPDWPNMRPPFRMVTKLNVWALMRQDFFSSFSSDLYRCNKRAWQDFFSTDSSNTSNSTSSRTRSEELYPPLMRKNNKLLQYSPINPHAHFSVATSAQFHNFRSKLNLVYFIHNWKSYSQM